MSCKGRAGPVEPATGVKMVALLKKVVVDGLAPGLFQGHSPRTISEALAGLIIKDKHQELAADQRWKTRNS